MTILVNASNLYVGGGVQVALSVIEEFANLETNFIAAVSPPVYKQLNGNLKRKCILIDATPSNIFHFSIRRRLDHIVSQYNVTRVFTIFGPSYWNPKVEDHTVGFALPWLIYDSSEVFYQLSYKEKLKKLILRYLQPFYYKRNANKIIVETHDAAERLINIFNFNKENVYCVSNTISSVFYDSKLYDTSVLEKLPKKGINEVWLLTVSHNYPHKNLNIIHRVLDLLPENYRFVLTLDKSFLKGLSKDKHDRIILTGNVTSAQCPVLYNRCDGMFLPTLLECFSASYAEAIYMKKPIFTSHLSFAKTVCKESAFYFDPTDPNDIAKVINDAYTTGRDIDHKLKIMENLLSNFPTASQRAIQYLNVIFDSKLTHKINSD